MRFQTAYSAAAIALATRGLGKTINTEETMTQQGDKNDSDINVIVARFRKTGQLPHNNKTAMYGDFTNVPDYRTAVEQVNAARDEFMKLPAKVRRRFDNNPAEFIEFATNPDNLDEMRKMGLAPTPEPEDNPTPNPAPTPAPVTNNGNSGTAPG